MGDKVLYAVIPRVRATQTRPEGAKWQCQLVMQYQYILRRRKLIKVHHSPGGFARQIVVRAWFEQERLFAADHSFGHDAFEFRLWLPAEFELRGKAVQQQETHVVPGKIVLWFGVAEADDEFHVFSILASVLKHKVLFAGGYVAWYSCINPTF